MVRNQLRAVAPGERPKRTRPSTVSEAVSGGSRRDELVAMRARIAKAIDEPNIRGADLAALSRRLLEIGKELDSLDAHTDQEAQRGGSTPDETWSAV